MTQQKFPVRKSPAATAVAAFVLMNLIFYILCEQANLRYVDAALTQNGQCFNFIATKESHQKIILLGSSVMDAPFAYYNNDQRYYERKDKTIGYWFLKNNGKYIDTANVSIEGGMISDLYILLKKYILYQSPPPVLVLGITPRDFIDYRFSQPAETYTFRAIVKLSDIDIWPQYINNVEQFCAFITEQFLSFYRYRIVYKYYFEQICNEKMAQALEHIRVKPASGFSSSPEVIMKGSSNKTSQIINQAFLTRIQQKTEEYKSIYSNPNNNDSLNRQMWFLEQSLILCRKHNLPVLLINLPLSGLNKKLMVPGFYPRFIKIVPTLASVYNIPFVNADMSIFKDYDDFWDTVHLNRLGGKKLINIICPEIKKLLETQENSLNKRDKL